MMMSASSASLRAISCPRASFRFSVRLFLLRDCTLHHSEVPSFSTRHWRNGSPPSGVSILMTSAPNSASMREQNGPGISVPSSRTLMPASGPDDAFCDVFSDAFVVMLQLPCSTLRKSAQFRFEIHPGLVFMAVRHGGREEQCRPFKKALQETAARDPVFGQRHPAVLGTDHFAVLPVDFFP